MASLLLPLLLQCYPTVLLLNLVLPLLLPLLLGRASGMWGCEQAVCSPMI
jgi:hypothetical protein